MENNKILLCKIKEDSFICIKLLYDKDKKCLVLNGKANSNFGENLGYELDLTEDCLCIPGTIDVVSNKIYYDIFEEIINTRKERID